MKSTFQKLKRQYRILYRLAFQYVLPAQTRYRLIRKNLVLPPEPPNGVIFKIAETQDELSQAFSLLHDAYVGMNLMDPHKSGMRVTKYHALPTSTTLIAVKNGRVAATLTLVRASPLGLPCEQLYDIDFLKMKHARIAEVSALAIDKKFSNQHGLLLWPLISFTYQYSSKYFGVDYHVIVVHPTWLDFYEAFMFFEPLKKKKTSSYGFVNGAPAVGGFLNLRQFYFKSEIAYSQEPLQKNLFYYLCERSFESFHFPVRNNATVSDPVMTPAMLDYFFNKATQNFKDFTPEQIQWLHALYHHRDYSRVLPKRSAAARSVHQRETRYDVDCKGRLQTPGAAEVECEIKTASLKGISGVMHRQIRFGEEYQMHVTAGFGHVIEVTVVPVWRKELGAVGFSISRTSESWIQFIESLEKSLLQVA